MENLIIVFVIGCIVLWVSFKLSTLLLEGIGGIWSSLINSKACKEQKEYAARSKALDEEAKKACGDDWVAQLGYQVKKSLYKMREIQNKKHPELFYRDENGLLQEIQKEEKEKKIALKIQDFKCPNCGAPLASITEKMTTNCNYCNITVAFVKN